MIIILKTKRILRKLKIDFKLRPLKSLSKVKKLNLRKKKSKNKKFKRKTAKTKNLKIKFFIITQQEETKALTMMNQVKM